MEIPSKIDGPVSFSAYHLKTGFGKDKIDKLFLLFGDWHNTPKYTCGGSKFTKKSCYKTKDCLSLGKFLKKTFKTNICTDFFLEEFYYRKIIKGEFIEAQDYTKLLIFSIRKEFSDCLQYSKSSCLKYGNVRMHTADLRDIEYIQRYVFPDEILEEYNLLDYMDFSKKRYRIAFYINLRDSEKVIKDNIKRTVKYILGLSNIFPYVEHSPQFEQLQYIENTRKKIQKQRKALVPSLRKKLDDSFIRKAYENYMNTVERSWKELSIFNIRHHIFYDLTNVIAIVMDIYLLFRSLRKDLVDSHIVIIYGGNNHIRSYKKFLFENGAKEIYHQKFDDINEKCITIPKEVQKEIYKITSKYPRYRCSYKESEMIKILTYYYDTDIRGIKKSIKETAKKHGITRKEALSIIWRDLKMKYME